MKSLKLIGLALGASFALSTAALAQDITIAVAGPMTGGESAFGRQMKNGAEQAVEDFNAAGGLLGMLTNSLMPFAYEHGGELAGVGTVVGFCLSLVTS